MKVYKVGGAVRDRLLGRPVTETDWVVVGATPEQMQALGFRQVGKDFPVFIHPETGEEYALARTERKTGRGYYGFEVHAAPDVTLEQDLMRRDLTINAMAEDENGEIIDPFGGRADLQAGILRHVSPAFAEDPVRILRVARFAARFDFTVAPETMDLMRQMVAGGEVDALVPERVWTELERAMGEDHPRRFVSVLRECGALKVLFPEIDRLFGVPQPARYHPEIDTGEHLLLALEVAAGLGRDPRMRFAVLTHDLGKGTTPPDQWPGHRGHEARGVELVRRLCRRYRAPNAYRELAELVARHHLNCHRAFELRPATLLEMLEAIGVPRRAQRLELFLQACEADARGRGGMQEAPYPQARYLRRAAEVVGAVTATPLLAEGYEGAALGEALRERRRQALAQLRREWRQ